MTIDATALESEDLFERTDTLAMFAQLFARLREGYGGSAFMLGGAGLGKTTLLRQSEARARSWAGGRVRRLLVGRADGVLFGSQHAFRFADQLFASVGADVMQLATAAHPDPQRSNRFLSALRALDECSSRAPLLLLLDDLQWADSDSLAIVEFLCRQIPTRAVAVIGTLRPWPAQAMETVRRLEIDGCVSVHELEPLSLEGSKNLLRSRVWADVTEEVAERACRACSGNPLLIEEVARSLLGGSQTPAVEPFSTGRRAILLRRFAGVSDQTFRFLRAASTLGVEVRPAVAARMVSFDAPKTDEALEEAGAAGLLASTDGSLSFVHPIFGEALYGGVQGPLLTELHEAAFRAIRFLGGSASEAADHAIEAGLTDEVATSVMRQAGQEALESVAWTEARRYLGRAVEIAGQAASTGMMREHAEALLGTGSLTEAVATLESLMCRQDIDNYDRARILIVLGRARLATARAESALTCFEEAARLFAPIDTGRSVEALIRCAVIARLLKGPRETLKFAERAKELSEREGATAPLQVDAAWGAAALSLGSIKGLGVLARSAETIEATPTLLKESGDGGWWSLVWCAGAAAACEKFDEAQKLCDLGFTIAEGKGWPTAMGALLSARADLMIRLGRLQSAEHDVERLEQLSEKTPSLVTFSIVFRTWLQLEMGLLAEAENGCTEIDTIVDLFDRPPPNLQMLVTRMRAELHMATGDVDEACTALQVSERVADSAGVLEPCVALWWAPALDAYRQAGRFGEIERIVNHLEDVTAGLPCQWPRAGAMAGRAMLAEHRGDVDSANKLYNEAITHLDRVPMPLERSSLLTWQGSFLRRQGDLRSARRTLYVAFQLADSRGAGLKASRARSELKLAGGRLRRAAPAAGSLTPREIQVAELAAKGHTTSEIASQLKIATRTGEHHLEAVYRKLGIRSRRDLMRKYFSGDLELGPPNAAINRDPSARDAESPP